MHLMFIVNVCFQGSKNIEGMILNWTQVVPIQLHAEAFKKMNQLRFLEVGPNMVEISQAFELPSRELRYLDWGGYNLASMPSNFHVDNLVVLRLQDNYLRHLWEGNMVLLLFCGIFVLD